MKMIRLLPALLALSALAAGGQRVVERGLLIERDGVFYESGSDEAFTGIEVEYRQDGTKGLKAEWLDGRLNGVRTVWYESGQKALEIEYREGKKHGKFSAWYESGKKRAEYHYREGKKHGPSTSWHENGNLKLTAEFLGGEPNGKFAQWYENGQQELLTRYRDGRVHGQETWWFDNGQKWLEGDYADGKMQGKWTRWYRDGGKESEREFRDGVEIGEKRWDEEGNEIVSPPEPEGFTRMLGDMLMVDWDTLMESLYDPEMVSELLDARLDEEGVQYLYGAFLRTVVRQSRPGGYRVHLAEKWRETLGEVHDLLRIVHNLDLAISGEDAEPWKIRVYGPLLSAMRSALLVDRLTLPLVLAGDDTRDLEWFEYHQHYMEKAARAYAAIFPGPGVLLDSYTHPETGVAFPDAIASLERGEVTEYERPGLGASVGYEAPGIIATIYLYDMGLESIPADLDSPILKDHFAAAVGDIVTAGKVGRYQEVEQLSQGRAAWGVAESAPSSLHAGFSYLRGGRECLSHLYLRGFRNHFLKVRFTYDRSAREEAEKLLEEFLEALANLTPGS